MRVCLVSQEYPPETGHGGIATQTHLKARGLASLGHEVVVISCSPHRLRTEQQRDRITVIRIPGPEVQFGDISEVSSWIAWSVGIAAEIRRLHAERTIDVVEVPDWASEGFFHLVARQPWDALPTVLQVHGSIGQLRDGLGWPEPGSEMDRLGSDLEAACARLADCIVASSPTSASWVQRTYGRAPGSIPVLHAGVDIDAFAPLDVPNPERAPTIMFVARVTPAKGADTLVRAARILREEFPTLRVRLVGRADAAFRLELEREATVEPRLGELPLLEFTGHIERDRMPEVMSGADVFALPTRFEAGPGFAFLEAMSCGLPVVGPSGGAIEDVVEHGRTGLLVPPGDVDALVDALGRLLRDPDLRTRLGAAARQEVVEHWSTDSWVPRIAAFYEEVIAATSTGEVMTGAGRPPSLVR